MSNVASSINHRFATLAAMAWPRSACAPTEWSSTTTRPSRRSAICPTTSIAASGPSYVSIYPKYLLNLWRRLTYASHTAWGKQPTLYLKKKPVLSWKFLLEFSSFVGQNQPINALRARTYLLVTSGLRFSVNLFIMQTACEAVNPNCCRQ